jgi:hypothetical protein
MPFPWVVYAMGANGHKVAVDQYEYRNLASSLARVLFQEAK